jgi:hypothetical protein
LQKSSNGPIVILSHPRRFQSGISVLRKSVSGTQRNAPLEATHIPWNVGYQGKSGLVVLSVSVSHFDPEPKLGPAGY